MRKMRVSLSVVCFRHPPWLRRVTRCKRTANSELETYVKSFYPIPSRSRWKFPSPGSFDVYRPCQRQISPSMHCTDVIDWWSKVLDGFSSLPLFFSSKMKTKVKSVLKMHQSNPTIDFHKENSCWWRTSVGQEHCYGGAQYKFHVC